MKKLLSLLICVSSISFNAEAQSIKRIDGSQIAADSLSAAIRLLMKEAESIGDIYTPWAWEHYIPYDQIQR